MGTKSHLGEICGMGNKRNGLTIPQDWNEYYGSNTLARLEKFNLPYYLLEIMNNEVFSKKIGKIFELGCGASQLLVEASSYDWEVSGIDFNNKSIDILEYFLEREERKIGEFICDDIFDYDCSPLADKYDIIISSGFLEHFNNPEDIIKKWRVILKPGGRIISMIPNLLSTNAKLLKKYDNKIWDIHVVYDPEQLDEMHINAGLKIHKSATYCGGYDVNMLIPWDKIKENNSLYVFKLLKYFGSFIGYFANVLCKNDSKRVNPIIYGVYINE